MLANCLLLGLAAVFALAVRAVVVLAGGGDGFGLGLLTDGASDGLHAVLLAGRSGRDLALVPRVTGCLQARKVQQLVLAVAVGEQPCAALALPVGCVAVFGAGRRLRGHRRQLMPEGCKRRKCAQLLRARRILIQLAALRAPPVGFVAALGAGRRLRSHRRQIMRVLKLRNLGSLVLLCMADGALLVLHAGLILGRLRVRHPKPSMSGRGNLRCCLDFLLSRLVGEQLVALLAAPVCLAALLGTRRRLFRNHCQRVSERAQEFRCVNDVLALAVGEQHFAILAFPVCLISAQRAGGCQCGNRLKGMTLRGGR